MSHIKDLLHWPHGRVERSEREIDHRAKSLNVTEEELRRAVEKVGTSAKKVIEYLRTQR